MFITLAGDLLFIALCLEGFLYGEISVLCAFRLTCTLANVFQLFSGLGFYSGIFAIYVQCSSKDSKTAMIIFYVLCLLYVLSTATVVLDFVYTADQLVIPVSINNSICIKTIFFLSVMQFGTFQIEILNRIAVGRPIVNGCCDFIAQCILVRLNHCTYHPFYSPSKSSHEDLPMLDRVG